MSGSQLMRSSGEEGVWHVLARKDGEDVFRIVPDNVNYEASESE